MEWLRYVSQSPSLYVFVDLPSMTKEISNDRLVIMVTHNPELAEQYSTRIIRLKDGEVTDDTMPYDGADLNAAQTPEITAAQVVQSQTDGDGGAISATASGTEVKKEVKKTNKGRKKKASMSIGMAFSLSLKNLLSKFEPCGVYLCACRTCKVH